MIPLLLTLAADAPLPPDPAAWAHFDWLRTLMIGDSVAHAVLLIALVTAAGLAIGAVRVRGVSLGIAGVLFVGLFAAHMSLRLNEHVMDFAREFGLILFVYTIGLQVGPGFLGSLRRAGLKLNLLAATIVLIGVLTTLGLVFVTRNAGKYRIEIPEAVGLLSGGTTNTPSLAAAQQALGEVVAGRTTPASADTAQTLKLPATGYAMAYPFGIVGIIASMMLVRALFHIDVGRERDLFTKQDSAAPPLASINLTLTNPNLDATPIGAVPMLNEPGVVVTRVLQGGKVYVAAPDTFLSIGDVLYIVGPAEKLEALKLVVGDVSPIDIRTLGSDITTRRLVVTQRSALGKTIEELNLYDQFGVTISRVSRAEIEIPAMPGWRFQFGDRVLVVGGREGIDRVAGLLGNSIKMLDHPQIIPVFVGIALGVLLGSCPFYLPGIPAPVKLGLAGGPLLVAIVLARIGQIGRLSWYMPRSANFALRELGIVLFLACVGLKAGDGFFHTLTSGRGIEWMAAGALITLLPLLTVGLAARLIFKMNYVTLCGLLAGSMTDPPALAFANTLVGAETPSVAYATVYPLTMILRVISAQAIVLFFYS